MSNFRRWLENIDDPNAITDIKGTAQLWYDKLPTEKPQENEEAIAVFVDSMSEPWLCGEFLAEHLNNQQVEQTVYKEPISNNLLKITDKRLGTATGIITNQEEPNFALQDDGNIIIQTPPLIYEVTDKELLRLIIHHELGHAIDFLYPQQFDIPSGRFRLNAEAYATNLNEARRLSGSLRWLLRKMGNVDQVIKLLKGQRQITPANAEKYHIGGTEPPQVSPFRLPPALIPVAEAFLKHFSKSLMGENLLDPPAMVASSQQEAQYCATTTAKIIQLFLFKQFVETISTKL